MRHVVVTSPADQRAAVATGHVALSPGFIEKNQRLRIDEAAGDGEVTSLVNHIRPQLLGGNQGLFLNVIFNFFNARCTVDSATGTLVLRLRTCNVTPGLST